MKKTITWFGVGLAAITLGVSGCGTAQPSNGTGNTGITASVTDKTVTIGYVDWSEDVATSYLWKNLLEKKGYTVQLKSLQLGPLFVGLQKGSVNLYFDAWLPTTEKVYMDKYGSDLTNLGKWYQGSTNEGFVVPKYMTNINSMADLNSHASEFDNRIVGIDPGAGETTLAKQAITAYGLNLSLQTSSSPAMLSALKRAYDQKQPIAVTLWSPHWAFSKYQLKYIADPKYIFGHKGWIQTEANKSWAAKHPTVTQWIQKFKLTPNQLGELEVDINNAGSKTAGVEKWVAANSALVNSWLS